MVKNVERRGAGGFTLIEVLAGGAAAMVVLGALAVSLGGATRGFEGIAARARLVARLAEADRAIRQAAARVHVPFWEVAGAVAVNESTTGAGITFGWLDGHAGKTVTFTTDGETLTITAGEETHRLGPFAGVEVQTLVTDDGVSGITVDIAVPGRSLVTAARFGAVPW